MFASSLAFNMRQKKKLVALPEMRCLTANSTNSATHMTICLHVIFGCDVHYKVRGIVVSN